MTPEDCPYEQDVVTAVLSRRWPHGSDEQLRAHAQQCAVCSTVTTVAELLRDDQSASIADVRVPAAGQVWWRAAVRARVEAVHAASQPITWMQGLAAAAIAGLAIALFGITWPLLREGVSRVRALAALVNPDASEVASLLGAAVHQSMPLLLFAGAFVLLTPIALYFALSDK